MMKKITMRVLLLLAVVSVAAGETPTPKLEKATFAGGCFWCMQPPFDHVPGVVETTVGYTGGHKDNPTYEEVSSGETGHAESVEVVFDPAKVSYAKLLDTFWKSIDPTQTEGQFVDEGSQYRTVIFYHNEEQKRQALASKEALAKSGHFDHPIVTLIVPATKFWPAEEYHQKYYLKSKLHYKMYRAGSGRDAFLQKTWGSEAVAH